MQIYTNLLQIPPESKGHVIAIGNFDGVHQGHLQLLARARKIADQSKRKLAVLTFEPHPRHLFRPDDPPFRLTSAATKARHLAQGGVDILYSLPFDWDFASLTAEQFINDILRQDLDAAHIVVGYDFCFGQLRKGTPETLEKSGLPLTIVEKISANGEALSSSAIRKALQLGKMDEANRLLGWDWEISGIVQKGDQRGREMGYPTANVPLGDVLHPAYGVYATWVRIAEDGENAPWMASATNIGIRPMFAVPIGQVEAHIFNFDRDIYGKTLHIRPVRRLRGEAKFESLDALITQIGQDCVQAREILTP